MEEERVDEPVRKRKRLSKNKKKNWRKTNIDDVEDHLEDVRIQHRTGGLAAEKSDEQLYFLHKDTAATEQDDCSSKTKKKAAKPLRCHALLDSYPKIKPFKVPHNVPKPENIEKRRSNRVLNSKKARPVRQVTPQAKAPRQEVVPADRDLWGGNATEVTPTTEHFLKYTCKAKIKAPKTVGSKSSDVMAVEKPHPGQSYNPGYKDHQLLLQSALDVEVKNLKTHLRVKRALDDQFPKGSDAPTQETWLAEMSAGLTDHDPSSHMTEEEGAELLKLSVNPAVRREDKKTEKQRRKERQKLEKEKEIKRVKSAKMKRNEIYRLKSVKRELAARETRLKQRAISKTVRKMDKKDLPKKLGKLKYTEGSIPLKLTDELQGSLRLLKAEGNLMEDRYKSLQKRNIIEPRTRAKKVRKYKQKKVEKRGHRQVTL